MGHSLPNHDIGRAMASSILRRHLKGLLSINLVVLVVIMLLDGEKFLVLEEDIFMPILDVQLEETLCSSYSDFLRSRSKEVSL
jgi:hypothetical protein